MYAQQKSLISYNKTLIHRVLKALTAFHVCHWLLSSFVLWLAESVRSSHQTETHTFIWRWGSINSREGASREQILTIKTFAAHRSAMAPTITAALTRPQEDLTLTQKVRSVWGCPYFSVLCNCLFITLFVSLQLRKPVVEKLRRERINSSIEQLKSLLGPDSKIEKADILEMTVCILRQLQKRRCTLDFTNVDRGHQVQETKHFVYKEDMQMYAQTRLTWCLNRRNSSSGNNLSEIDFSPLSSTAQSSTRKVESLANSAPWRPW